jgi:hypothetical protein
LDSPYRTAAGGYSAAVRRYSVVSDVPVAEKVVKIVVTSLVLNGAEK